MSYTSTEVVLLLIGEWFHTTYTVKVYAISTLISQLCIVRLFCGCVFTTTGLSHWIPILHGMCVKVSFGHIAHPQNLFRIAPFSVVLLFLFLLHIIIMRAAEAAAAAATLLLLVLSYIIIYHHDHYHLFLHLIILFLSVIITNIFCRCCCYLHHHHHQTCYY